MPRHPPPPRPLGQATRGKTAPNRLRRVDVFVAKTQAPLLRRCTNGYRGAFFVDLGYGTDPSTTLETAARLRQVAPRLPVLGVEINPERVAAAQTHADKLTQFRLGGFNLPLHPSETARSIRAFNVLRQYDEPAVRPAHTELCRHLLPGGYLLEGTSDPFGRLWVANLLQRTTPAEAIYKAVIFSTNFRWGFEPGQFQPVLPKNFIHRMRLGEPIFQFFEAWKMAHLQNIARQSLGLRQVFVATAHRLALQGYQLTLRRWWLRRGYLIWHPSPGVLPPLNLS